jgi:thiosulfate/3-mercaptopyruvate sulfurtransferase
MSSHFLHATVTLSLAATAVLAAARGNDLTSAVDASRRVAHGVPAESLLVSATWLAARLTDPDVVILHVAHDSSAYASGHIPGARWLSYMAFIENRDNRGTELPSADSLRRVFEALGVSTNSRVILYGDLREAARAFFTLDYLGHEGVSIMDGGVAAWRAAGNALTTDAPHVRRGSFTPRVRTTVVADAAWIQPRLGRAGMFLLDTRTPEEYAGTGARGGIPSKGHLQGAQLVQWQDYVSGTDDQRLKSREALQELLRARGVAKTDTLVAYCYIGYRASVSYFISRLLGHPAKLYDGSYDDWAKRELPLVKP